MELCYEQFQTLQKNDKNKKRSHTKKKQETNMRLESWDADISAEYWMSGLPKMRSRGVKICTKVQDSIFLGFPFGQQAEAACRLLSTTLGKVLLPQSPRSRVQPSRS